MRELKIGSTIYHESRYWVQYPVFDEVPGWNARYLPYVVVKVTPATIYATGCGPDGQTSRVQLPQKPRHARPTTLEADGKQYHSRFHEYFYVEIPKAEPTPRPVTKCAYALLLLGLVPPYSEEDVRRAYRRLAKAAHPDAGGSSAEFVKLKDARDTALRGY
jgi:hypothetical protein